MCSSVSAQRDEACRTACALSAAQSSTRAASVVLARRSAALLAATFGGEPRNKMRVRSPRGQRRHRLAEAVERTRSGDRRTDQRAAAPLQAAQRRAARPTRNVAGESTFTRFLRLREAARRRARRSGPPERRPEGPFWAPKWPPNGPKWGPRGLCRSARACQPQLASQPSSPRQPSIKRPGPTCVLSSPDSSAKAGRRGGGGGLRVTRLPGSKPGDRPHFSAGPERSVQEDARASHRPILGRKRSFVPAATRRSCCFGRRRGPRSLRRSTQLIPLLQNAGEAAVGTFTESSQRPLRGSQGRW
eukprot:scaffold744_cov370-Prasinococcus_capsulatus_cf.AAC.11